MNTNPVQPAALSQPSPCAFVLGGAWTAQGIGANEVQLRSTQIAAKSQVSVDAAHIQALDTAGAWLLQELLTGGAAPAPQ